MESIFTRIKNSISADIHHLLDKKEEKNPLAAFNQHLRQSEVEKKKVKQLLERHYRLKESFTKEYIFAEEKALKRKEQADIAKKANEEQLYNYAIKEFEEYNSRKERLKTAREKTNHQIEQLEAKYKEMNHKLKDMRIKQMELMGRENVVRTNQKINQILEADGKDHYNRFNEIERFIDRIERRVNDAYYESTFDQRIAELEQDFQNDAFEKTELNDQ